MISDSADVSKGMTSSELIQVKQVKSGDWIAGILRSASRSGRHSESSYLNLDEVF